MTECYEHDYAAAAKQHVSCSLVVEDFSDDFAKGSKMASWRMAFRAGTNGYDLWPECRKRGIAIIQYGPVNDLDLSQYPVGEPREVWKELAGPPQTSLRRFLEMQVGDTLYVKSGPKIVGRGTVDSPYYFDHAGRVEHAGELWQHQRKVIWEKDVPEVDNPTTQNIVTVKPLTAADVRKIEGQYREKRNGDARTATDNDIEGLRYEIVTMTTKRSRRLRDTAFKLSNGICRVCERDYSKLLDGRGIRVLQVHHTRMLSRNEAEVRTTLKDLVVVCANCHLLLHLDPKKPLTVKRLKQLLKTNKGEP